MNCLDPASPSTETKPSNKTWFVLWLIVILSSSLVAVSNQSFWIDEFSTTHFAIQPSLGTEWREMARLKWPEIQAPLYMAYIWAWEKIFGHGEWVMRVAGVPWFIAGALLFITSWKLTVQRAWACVAVGLNTFAWFYLNEARLYAFQVGLALSVVASLVHLKVDDLDAKPVRPRWLVIFSLSAILLSLLNVLGMIWVSSAFLLLPVLFPLSKLRRWAKDHLVLVIGTTTVLALCAAYYLWTRTLGIAPTDVGRTDWRTLCFIIYEHLGFNGLGPGRYALRENGIPALKAWLPMLLLYGGIIAIVLSSAVKKLLDDCHPRSLFLAGLALCVPAAFLVTMALTAHFRLLGRHFTPITSLVVLLFSLGLNRLWLSGTRVCRASCLAFICVSVLSCLSQRFSVRHEKDDFRDAANVAKTYLMQGKTVWWNADGFGADYYRVPTTTESPAPAKALLCPFPIAGFEKNAELPDMVISSSKTDIYDRLGVLRALLAREHYVIVKNLPAFDIFQKRTDEGGGRISKSVTQ